MGVAWTAFKVAPLSLRCTRSVLSDVEPLYDELLMPLIMPKRPELIDMVMLTDIRATDDRAHIVLLTRRFPEIEKKTLRNRLNLIHLRSQSIWSCYHFRSFGDELMNTYYLESRLILHSWVNC